MCGSGGGAQQSEVVRSHSSSGNALNEILEKFVNGKKKFTSGAIAERAVCQDSCKNQTKRKRNDDHDRSSNQETASVSDMIPKL